MDVEKLRAVTTQYRRTLTQQARNIASPDGKESTVRLPIPYPNCQPGGWPDLAVWMCDRILNGFLPHDVETARLWFGFLQGMFYLALVYTIDELRVHRSEKHKDIEAIIKEQAGLNP